MSLRRCVRLHWTYMRTNPLNCDVCPKPLRRTTDGPLCKYTTFYRKMKNTPKIILPFLCARALLAQAGRIYRLFKNKDRDAHVLLHFKIGKQMCHFLSHQFLHPIRNVFGIQRLNHVSSGRTNDFGSLRRLTEKFFSRRQIPVQDGNRHIVHKYSMNALWPLAEALLSNATYNLVKGLLFSFCHQNHPLTGTPIVKLPALESQF